MGNFFEFENVNTNNSYLILQEQITQLKRDQEEREKQLNEEKKNLKKEIIDSFKEKNEKNMKKLAHLTKQQKSMKKSIVSLKKSRRRDRNLIIGLTEKCKNINNTVNDILQMLNECEKEVKVLEKSNVGLIDEFIFTLSDIKDICNIYIDKNKEIQPYVDAIIYRKRIKILISFILQNYSDKIECIKVIKDGKVVDYYKFKEDISDEFSKEEANTALDELYKQLNDHNLLIHLINPSKEDSVIKINSWDELKNFLGISKLDSFNFPTDIIDKAVKGEGEDVKMSDVYFNLNKQLERINEKKDTFNRSGKFANK